MLLSFAKLIVDFDFVYILLSILDAYLLIVCHSYFVRDFLDKPIEATRTNLLEGQELDNF
jgi:hypothetical protein